jgi:hypothetical protein
MYDQQKFKYQIYADGHVAAMRYTSMMVLGSVIFKVRHGVRASDLHLWDKTPWPTVVAFSHRACVPCCRWDRTPRLVTCGSSLYWCRTTSILRRPTGAEVRM